MDKNGYFTHIITYNLNTFYKLFLFAFCLLTCFPIRYRLDFETICEIVFTLEIILFVIKLICTMYFYYPVRHFLFFTDVDFVFIFFRSFIVMIYFIMIYF